MDIRGRAGLSPILAILIGLVIVIVAGILLAQLYFNYASITSTRPMVYLEYVDVVGDTLIMNLKNVGDSSVENLEVDGDGINNCRVFGEMGPGKSFSMTCELENSMGSSAGVITLRFSGGSSQVIPFRARAIYGGSSDRAPGEDGGGGDGGGDGSAGRFTLDVVEERVYGNVGGVYSVAIKLVSVDGYEGEVSLSYMASPTNGITDAVFSKSTIRLAPGGEETVMFSFRINTKNEITVNIIGEGAEIQASDEFVVVGGYFTLDVLDDEVGGPVGGDVSVRIELRSENTYSGCIDLGYEASPLTGVVDGRFEQGTVCLSAGDVKVVGFSFKIGAPRKTVVRVSGVDSGSGMSDSDEFSVSGRLFTLTVLEDWVSGVVGGTSEVNIELGSVEGYSDCVKLRYVVDPEGGIVDGVFSENPVCLGPGENRAVKFKFKINVMDRANVRVIGEDPQNNLMQSDGFTVVGQYFTLDVSEDEVAGAVWSHAKVSIKLTSMNDYAGCVKLRYIEDQAGSIFDGAFERDVVCLNPGETATLTFSFKINVTGSAKITVVGEDPGGSFSGRDEFKVVGQYFTLNVREDRVRGPVGGTVYANVSLAGVNGYSGCIRLEYGANPPNIVRGYFEEDRVCLSQGGAKTVKLKLEIGAVGEASVRVVGKDEGTGFTSSDTFTVEGYRPGRFTLTIPRENRTVRGYVGQTVTIHVVLTSVDGYSGSIHLSYSDQLGLIGEGSFEQNPVRLGPGEVKRVKFTFKILNMGTTWVTIMGVDSEDPKIFGYDSFMVRGIREPIEPPIPPPWPPEII